MYVGKGRLGLFEIGVGAVLVILLVLMITSWAHRRNNVAPHAPLHSAPASNP